MIDYYNLRKHTFKMCDVLCLSFRLFG